MHIRRVVLAFMGVVVLAGVTHAAPQPVKKDKKSDPGGLGARWWQAAVGKSAPIAMDYSRSTSTFDGRAPAL
jgi:hypothetical protein